VTGFQELPQLALVKGDVAQVQVGLDQGEEVSVSRVMVPSHFGVLRFQLPHASPAGRAGSACPAATSAAHVVRPARTAPPARR
jgi:hypothetical protein